MQAVVHCIGVVLFQNCYWVIYCMRVIRPYWQCIGQIEASTIPCPTRHTPGIWHLCRPGEEGIWLSEFLRGWGIWSPCVRGGEFELHPWFRVKSLAWRAIMGDAVLEDFRGKDCAFVANWLQGLCRIWRYLNFNIFNIGFRLWIYECIKLCL